MTVVAEAVVLDQWAARSGKVVPRRFAKLFGIRFAFYGRMSTMRFQDRRSSWWWPHQFAGELIAGRGKVVAEFFDVGVSRRRLWTNRPEAARLLAMLADAHRGFDAVVVGEFERAFHRGQVPAVMEVFNRCGVQLWLPEVGGPLDLEDPEHALTIAALSNRSGREVSRATVRTTAAMRIQVEHQGRSMGGRPPYGYRYGDGGPHPNKADAAWGRRLQVLEVDPDTGPWVTWIFARRLAGDSYISIAEQLDRLGVPCPSKADPERNPHRSGGRWQPGTVRAILLNPKYTGRQVWGRQCNDHGGTTNRVWNAREDWVISTQLTHPTLVSDAEFIAVQPDENHTLNRRGAPNLGNGTGGRIYALVGLVFCGLCGRRMEPYWAAVRAAYRCRHGARYHHPSAAERQPDVYVREDQLLTALTAAADEDPGLGWAAGKHSGVLAALLRRRRATIVIDRTQWTVEWPGEQVVLWPSDSSPATVIPAQRRSRL